jgi:hypothetical protein
VALDSDGRGRRASRPDRCLTVVRSPLGLEADSWHGPPQHCYRVRGTLGYSICHTTTRKRGPLQKINTPLSRVDADRAGGET